MAHGHAGEIRNPGTFETPSSLKMMLIALAAIGVGTFAAGMALDTKHTWISFLQNNFYFTSLALGGLFFAAIQWLTSAMWSAPIRRISESFTAYLPIALLGFLGLSFGLKDLYTWTDPAVISSSVTLQHKTAYLNIPFFIIRNVIALVLWYLFARAMIGRSIAQDSNRDATLSRRNANLAPFFLLIFAFGYTMASFDQLMSLDPLWFSTIFGVYCFAGLFYSTLALTCLVTLYLKAKGKLEGVLNDNHLHDIGKFMFAFTVFWAYIGFSQFMLIWYANLPEETGYYIKRMNDGWMGVSVFLLVGKFMLPFFLLLPREMKRNTKRLAMVACFMMFAQWVDVLWMVQPEFYAAPKVGLIDIGMTLGFAGLFGLAVFRFLSKNNIVAIGDPRLAESVHHHHQ
jgi:hypothetical protein